VELHWGLRQPGVIDSITRRWKTLLPLLNQLEETVSLKSSPSF
jgi:hypothetical protein